MKTLKRWRTLLAVAALLVSGGLVSTTALAASVTPTAYPGNFTDCDDLPGVGNWGGVGFSTQTTPVSGQPYDLGGGQSVTFTYNPNDPKLINFTSTIPLDYVVVKGGPNYNVYHYVPPEGADTDLTSPLNDGNPVGVSHVVVCFIPRPTAAKTADALWKRWTDWTLQKTVTPENIKMFDGDSHEAEYTVTVTPTTRKEYRVSGTITVKDPFDFGWNATAAVDQMTFNSDPTTFTLNWTAAGGDTDTMSCTKPAPNADKIILSCSYEFVLQANAYPFLASATGGLNSVGVTTVKSGETLPVSATQSFAIPANPAASFGDSLAVDDDKLPGDPDHTFSLGGSYVWQYGKTFACDQDEGSHVNTATGSWSTGPSTQGTASDSATVNVVCETVAVSKTATTRFDRDYGWTPDKKIVANAADAAATDASCEDVPIVGGPYAGSFLCDDLDIELNPGGSYQTVYRLAATRAIQADTGHAVSGAIHVSWPAGMPNAPVFDPDEPVDTLHLSDNTTPSPDVTCDPQAATALDCTYDYPLSGQLTGYNEASIHRVKRCYAVDGSSVACASPGNVAYTSNQAQLVWNAPDVETDACVAVSDLFNGLANPALNLGPSLAWLVSGSECASFARYVTDDPVDNGIDESLDIDSAWILPDVVGPGLSCEFMVPNLLTIGTDNGASKSDEAIVTVSVPLLCVEQGCTYTQGYWKTHVDYAPKPQFAKKRDATWDEIDGAGTADEDAIFFLSGQSYVAVMWTAPKGNTYYNLAHQYIAAKLNVLSGASDAAVAADLAQAEAWFSAYAPSHNFWKKSQSAITLAGKLASYNEGSIGPGHCSVSPATLLSAQ